MSNIEKILEGLNIPKQILDKSEKLVKVLFGPSFDEIGGMISDHVKLRRLKNQIKIFTKAHALLKDNNIDPKKVNLKVLAPLIELSSYEEEESLQNKWANLIVNVLDQNSNVLFQQNCINILNKLSPEDAKLLDKLFDDLSKKQEKRYVREVKRRGSFEYQNSFWPEYSSPELYPVHLFVFSISSLKKDYNSIANIDIELSISNLVSLGLLKWETDIDVRAEKASEEPDDSSIEVEVDIYNNDDIIFTKLGYEFVKICKF